MRGSPSETPTFDQYMYSDLRGGVIGKIDTVAGILLDWIHLGFRVHNISNAALSLD